MGLLGSTLAGSLFLKQDFIYLLFREREREGDREGEKQQCARDTSVGCLLHAPNRGTWATTQARALAGNRTCDLLVCRPHEPGLAGSL